MSKTELTEREKEVADLLLQGKGNKQIALALSITESTVEFHLNNIYAKLGVNSRTEAFLQLGKPTAKDATEEPGNSGVAEKNEQLYSGEKQASTNRKNKNLPALIIAIIGILIIATLFFQNQKPRSYEREAEFPDEFTVGQDLDRSNASSEKVHGQFGSQGFGPWLPQAGFVKYYNIEIPKSGMLYLQLRYSKYSKSSVPILIYLDDEQDPRESIYPIDLGDWNKFIWTEWIALGDIKTGIHSIKFFTNGQEFGVADLDKFILTTKPP